MKPCMNCGMLCHPNEYHPHAACLMFEACHNGDTVRGNLQAVKDDGRATPTPPVEPVKEADVSAIRDAALDEAAKLVENYYTNGDYTQGWQDIFAAAIRALRGRTA